jgi:hypothetical protein
MVGVLPDLEDDTWTFGSIFFKTYLTAFDLDQKRMGKFFYIRFYDKISEEK